MKTEPQKAGEAEAVSAAPPDTAEADPASDSVATSDHDSGTIQSCNLHYADPVSAPASKRVRLDVDSSAHSGASQRSSPGGSTGTNHVSSASDTRITSNDSVSDTSADQLGAKPQQFDRSKMTFDDTCAECSAFFPDPQPHELIMYLHAWKNKVQMTQAQPVFFLCLSTSTLYSRLSECSFTLDARHFSCDLNVCVVIV